MEPKDKENKNKVQHQVNNCRLSTRTFKSQRNVGSYYSRQECLFRVNFPVDSLKNHYRFSTDSSLRTKWPTRRCNPHSVLERVRNKIHFSPTISWMEVS